MRRRTFTASALATLPRLLPRLRADYPLPPEW